MTTPYAPERKYWSRQDYWNALAHLHKAINQLANRILAEEASVDSGDAETEAIQTDIEEYQAKIKTLVAELPRFGIIEPKDTPSLDKDYFRPPAPKGKTYFEDWFQKISNQRTEEFFSELREMREFFSRRKRRGKK